MLRFVVVVALLQYVKSDVDVSIYGNSALTGTPKTKSTSPNLELELPLDDGPFSAEVLGTLRYDEPDKLHAFSCNFNSTASPGSIIAFVWIGDHLVCHTQPPFGNTPDSTDGSVHNPLRNLTKTMPLTVVMHVYSSVYGASRGDKLGLSVQWQALSSPGATETAGFSPISANALSPGLPPLEITRRAVQNSEKQGWNLWSYNMLSAVRLPESCAVTTALCQLSSGQCLLDTHIEDNRAAIRVGIFAADRSYWQFYLGFKGVNVSLSYTGGRDTPLRIMAEPQGCGAAAVNCSDYALVVTGSFKWQRAGNVSVASGLDAMRLAPFGQEPVEISTTAPGDPSLPIPKSLAATPHLALSLGSGPIGIVQGSTSGPLATIQSDVEAARQAELKELSKYGDLAEVKSAVQAATMWNYIYVPTEYGPFLPVSRSWNFVKKQMNDDWAYVIFDWDNIFASYMSSIDARSKNVSYSNFIQVIRSRTAQGFVPNYSAGGRKSIDRTEPPIGAHVLLQLYNKYKDAWLVGLLFDDIVAWNTWFLEARTLGPLGLVSLGSDSYPGYTDNSPGTMQGARFESGLDNSPMYDGDFFNASVKPDGSGSVGQMELYDVGMASMFVAEAEALATLARDVLHREEEATMLSQRAEAQRKLISEHLWDKAGGIYTNKFWNGSFYPRISPTSFYSMLAGAASDEQAETMMKEWLTSPEP